MERKEIIQLINQIFSANGKEPIKEEIYNQYSTGMLILTLDYILSLY